MSARRRSPKARTSGSETPACDGEEGGGAGAGAGEERVPVRPRERYGPLELDEGHKADGRALILYRHAPPP